MTKSNVHLIADKSIGGVQREFEEVRREVAVGDYVWLVNVECVVVVSEHSADHANRQIISGDTKALDPTDIVVIDGTRYQLAERKAEVGEKVLVISTVQDVAIGTVGTCTVNNEFDDGSIDSDLDHAEDGFIDADLTEYRVLIPVDSASVEPTPDIHDLIANLATRVTALERITGELVRAKSSLESQLRDTQNNVQTFAEQTEANTKDIKFLDDRTYVPEKPTKSAEEILREISKIIERDDKRCGR